MAFCKEKDIEEYTAVRQSLLYHVIAEVLSPTYNVMLSNKCLEGGRKNIRGVRRLLQNVLPSHLLDKDLYDFEHLLVKGEKGDIPNGYLD